MRTAAVLAHLLVSSKYFLHARGDGPGDKQWQGTIRSIFSTRVGMDRFLDPNILGYIIFPTTRVGID